MNKQLVLLEFHNCTPQLYELISKDLITLDKAVEYFEENEDFNEDKDSITFVDKPSKIKI